MKPTERLIDKTQNRLVRDLLRSAETDCAPDNTAAKVAFALGLGSSAVVTTVATSAAASSGFVSGTGGAVGASAITAGTVAAVPAAGAIAAGVPAAGAVSALGLLKVMAAVSLACGTLSYGGVKLALWATEKPAVMAQVQLPAGTAPRLPRGMNTHAAVLASQSESNLPAPPPPPDNDANSGVTAARGQERRPVGVTEAASVRETNAPNVGRHAPPINGVASVTNAAPTAITAKSEKPAASAVTEPHSAAFADDARTAASPPPVSPISTLEREVAQLDHARAALAAGHPAQALRELDQYRVQSPRGALAAESVVLRVKALLALGQRAAAEAEASALILNAPQSRHAERLREILGSGVSPK